MKAYKALFYFTDKCHIEISCDTAWRLCNVSNWLSRLHFTEVLSLWVDRMAYKRQFYMRFGGWNEVEAILYAGKLGQVLVYLAHTHCFFCWLISFASFPETATPYPRSSLNFSNSWARCAFSFVTKGINIYTGDTSLWLEMARTDAASWPSLWVPAHAGGFPFDFALPHLCASCLFCGLQIQNSMEK